MDISLKLADNDNFAILCDCFISFVCVNALLLTPNHKILSIYNYSIFLSCLLRFELNSL